jgi:hypothetical protein
MWLHFEPDDLWLKDPVDFTVDCLEAETGIAFILKQLLAW